MKKCEIEKLEKEKQDLQKDNYMIFERHFEDIPKEEEKKEEPKEDLGSLDSGPFQFLEGTPEKEDSAPEVPQQHLKMHILEEAYEGSVEEEKGEAESQQILEQKKTDELIEEYERKINKTK